MQTQIKSVDVLVIGAGPSGTIAAAILKKQGYNVCIVEKLSFPRFVIGESLLPRCMEAFEEAGLLSCLEKKGYQQKFGAKFVAGDGANEQIFDINFSEAHTQGKTWTWQVPREDFDKTLADECEKKGIPVSYLTEVVAIEFNADESSVTTIKKQDGSHEKIQAKFIVDGSGYGRVIPKLFSLDKPSNQPQRQTLFTHFKDVNRETSGNNEPNRITIYIYDAGTWVWCIPFSNGYCSLGFVGSPDFFEKLKQDTPEEKLKYLISTHKNLNARFGNCEMRFSPMTLMGWSSSTEKFYGKGYVLTGNVTEFLDPIFSSGVTLASVSAQGAARLVHKKLSGQAVDWETEYQLVCQKGVDVFRTYVEGWYDQKLHTIFFSKNQNENMRKQISSVLAGYVWDDSNPFVSQHKKYIEKLAQFLETRS
jgi:flavin-dependent dehydrogenase